MKPIMMTRDCELSTTGQDHQGQAIASWQVTQDVLRHIPTAMEERGGSAWFRPPPATGTSYYASPYSTDCLRRYTTAGQCYYADMSHCECATAETSDPREFAAQSFSVLLLAERARQLAVQEKGGDYHLSAANADTLDPAISWGSHLNASISTELWEDLFLHHARPAALGFVSSAVAALVPFFGSGYLLPLKDGSTIFSLSARAHHVSRVHTISTTEAFRRGLLNSRREPHCTGMERLHLIGFDFTLISSALLCSMMQCMLAAADRGESRLMLHDPVRACHGWSWGLDLNAGKLQGTATLTDGRAMTLSEYIRELATLLLGMCEDGTIDSESAPRAGEHLPLIIALTHYLDEGSWNQCARHLDFAAKLLYLLNAGNLGDAESRLIDHDFTNTDSTRGAMWHLWEEGLIDPLVSREEVDACLQAGPQDSRAWGRGKLIEKFSDHICDVDWAYIDFRRGAGVWSPRLRVEMPQLDSFSKASFGPTLQQSDDVDQLEAVLCASANGAARPADPLADVPHQLATYDRDLNGHE